MNNTELEAKLNNIVELAKKALCETIYLQTRYNSDDEYSVNKHNIQCITVEHVNVPNTELFNVYGDSHSLLKGSYDSSDIGVTLFSNKDIAEKALAGEEYTVDADTTSLKNIFVALEDVGRSFGSEEVFCVIKDTASERYQVSVMSIFSISIIGYPYHYRGDRTDVCKDKPAIMFKVADEIGSTECVLGETCFLDTKQAMEKAKELNKNS